MLPTNFLYKPWSSLLTLLMLFFIAQHTQRHFWLGYIWSYTEIHRFYFLSFSSYLFLHCNIRTFSVEEKIHTACHTPQNQVWFTVHNTSSAGRTTGQHFLMMLESVGQLHCSALALHAMRGLFQVSVGLLYSFSPHQAPGSLTPRLANG